MAEQDWVRPVAPVEAAGTAWAAGRPGDPAGHSPARFELRPLSIGEILDRTFALYRSRFWLFAGISMVAASVNVVGQALSLAAAQKVAREAIYAPAPANPANPFLHLRTATAAQLPGYAVMILFVLISAVTQAATALALTQVYLHRSTSVKQALTAVGRRWYRWIGIALWQGWSMAWIPLAAMVPAVLLLAFGARANNTGLTVIGVVLVLLAVLGGTPAGVILYLRNALAVPAAVTEGLTIRPAMRRSKVLAAGTKGRIFVVLLIAFCLLEVVAVLQSPVAMLMVFAPQQQHYLARGISLVIAFAGHTLVAPVALIGLTLVYFDQRVRKEALDLELLLQGARQTGAQPPPPPAALTEGYAPPG
jgi:hypothetical protein